MLIEASDDLVADTCVSGLESYIHDAEEAFGGPVVFYWRGLYFARAC
jgi:hypothetical protein